MRFQEAKCTRHEYLFTAAAIVVALSGSAAHAQSVSMSVSKDQALAYPSTLTSWPDEHQSFMPLAAGGYLVFGSSGVKGGLGGAVVLQTQDLQTFAFATSLGYPNQVMNPPVAFAACNPTYDASFDENYAGPGTVVQDPTLPPGNLIMIYEAENHCPGGVNQFPYYASAGFARSSDNGVTWPAPYTAALGGPNRYPVLQSATPEPTTPENPQINLGNAIPTAFIDGDFIYIPYETFAATNNDGLIRVARANLITDNVGGRLQFHKWDNGSFSQNGLGGADSGVLPTRGCPGNQRTAEISHNDAINRYLMVFVCINTEPAGEAAWYFSTATSLSLQDWTPPKQIANSLYPVLDPCMGASDGGTQFDGFYPSLMTPGAQQGHTLRTGNVFFLNGCDGGSPRTYASRQFTITGSIAAHDFNGDGKSDVLWRDNLGNVAVWLMNGSTLATSSIVGNVPATWSIVGQRDFNGDGNADLLWRDTSGNVGIWLMNGTQILSTATLGAVPTNWSVAGTGDFNSDGFADILWRDNLGNVGIWLMNGTQVMQSAVVGNVPTTWVVAGADTMGHIFWRNTTTGDVGIWVMNGTAIASTADFGVVPLSWTVAGVGDFDGNGSTDILWRDKSGNVGVWLLNGTQILSIAVLGNTALTWSIAETGDINGDGDSDILWIDNVGNVGAWFMNGASASSTAIYGNVGTRWSVQSLNAD